TVHARPPGVQDPYRPTTTPTPAPACDEQASLRPDPLPAPARMPAGTRMAEIQNRGRLIVGVGPNYYLLSYWDPYERRIRGFEADIAWELAASIFGDRDPGRIQFRVLNPSERKDALGRGDVDLVIASMTMTCERRSEVTFSAAYGSGGQRVLVLRDSPARTITDLKGKRVCASLASTQLPRLAAHPAGLVVVGANNIGDCVVMLQQRQIDAVSTGGNILAGFLKQDRGTRLLDEPPLADEFSAIALAHDGAPELVRFVNAVLERMRADGTWARLYREWLNDVLGPATQPEPRYQ
ncbi:MAG TPA: glutamate ABC transporter substrate-binding protein, partial [Actinokineospora sp.]|nr:glutamate ABC transporter substrate-binding protein [Actinokineospora sp.]